MRWYVVLGLLATGLVWEHADPEAVLVVGLMTAALTGSWWLAASGERKREACEREIQAMYRATIGRSPDA